MMRVAAYCRVSTDKEDQANSLDSQKRYFEEYINRRRDWILTEIYADNGLTGTSTKKRREFNRMIADARLGKMDMIITKEVSRFARNTVDTLKFTRELKTLGIGVFFMLDNIDTLAPDGELRLTIMASLAQEESRKTSERVKWGQRRQMEKGVVFGRDMLGYDARGGRLYVNEGGAEIVRIVFHKYVNEKKGTYTICRELREAGYRTATGNAIWTNTVIRKILRNEKYCGDLVQKKTYTPDYLTHEKKYNRGEEDLVVIHDHHEPIISREMWDAAQKELDGRAEDERRNAKRGNRYPLSGKIICGECGGKFVSRSKKRADGSVYHAWRCAKAVKYGTAKVDNAGNNIGCDMGCQIRDETFMEAIRQVITGLEIDRETVIRDVAESLRSSVPARRKETETCKRIEKIKLKAERLLDLYLNGDLEKDEYKRRKRKCDEELEKLKNNERGGGQISLNDMERYSDMEKYMRNVLYGLDADEIFYKNIVEKIKVRGRERFDIRFDSAKHDIKVTCRKR